MVGDKRLVQQGMGLSNLVCQAAAAFRVPAASYAQEYFLAFESKPLEPSVLLEHLLAHNCNSSTSAAAAATHHQAKPGPVNAPLTEPIARLTMPNAI